MKIAVLGSGMTGLAAAYRLLEKGHQVTMFEKETQVGGLAVGFGQNNWAWTVEKAYHHWFTNDKSVLSMAEEIGIKVLTVRPRTDMWMNGQIRSFDSPLSVLRFPYLSVISRIRVGLGVAYLKLNTDFKKFEKTKALNWCRQVMGQEVVDKIWEPMFQGKFSHFREEISLTWFWARIYKRTPALAYPEGGFQKFSETIAQKITERGGKIVLNCNVEELRSDKKCRIKVGGKWQSFDKVIVTLPTPVLVKITKGLNPRYVKRISAVDHLHALSMVLVLSKSFMKKTYWLNITDKSCPFLVLAEHTNFMDRKYYGGNHLLYIGNYLPQNHKFLKMSKAELLKAFDPYLRLLNPKYKSQIISSHLFLAPFAQPVVTTGYRQRISKFRTLLKNVYIANMDMVYPWDRGTNYAVEMGQKVAELVSKR